MKSKAKIPLITEGQCWFCNTDDNKHEKPFDSDSDVCHGCLAILWNLMKIGDLSKSNSSEKNT